MTDLKKEDFVLYDNGQHQVITEFEIRGLEGSGRAAEKTETGLVKTPTQDTNRKYFIFLDVQGSDVNDASNAKKVAVEFIATKLKPGDEVGVLTYTPMQGLNLVESLTSDKKKIKTAIERAKDIPPTPGYDPASGSGTGRPPDVAKMETQPDRIALEGSVAIYAGKISRGEERGLDVMFPGLGASGRFGLDFHSNWIMRGGVKEPYIFTEHPLKEFSLASGGQYFADIKDVQTIAADLQVLSENYYVLGYYINEQWDGKLHQIKVEVREPRHRVFVQEGYHNPRPYAQWTEIERQIHLYDLAFTDTPASKDFLDVSLEVLFVLDEKGSKCIFLSKMVVDEKTGIPAGRAELYAVVFDINHKVVQTVRGEIDLTAYAQQVFYPYAAVSLKPGEYNIRFVARNMAAGQALIGKSSLTIPKTELSGLQFHSSLLLIPGN